MSAMQLDLAWSRMVELALLGTAASPPAAPNPGAIPPGVEARLAGHPPEASFLHRAAMIASARAAGWNPPLLPGPDGAPAPQEELASVSRGGTARLLRMLAGEHPEALPEWLRSAAHRGLRVPPGAIPALLEHCRPRRALWPLVLPVLGARGRWLASQNPVWELVTGGPAKPFAEASPRERLEEVSALRRTDPARARALVAEAWKTEPPEQRLELLGAFRAGLSVADEDFLEECLSDRKKDVRRLAADLLARLPTSRLSRRMAERARGLLELRSSTFLGLGRARIEVDLPPECSQALVRDGLEPKRPHERIGERSWWLLQILGATPLDLWTESWRVRPAIIADALEGNEHEEVLHEGWLLAAERQANAEWLTALISRWPPRRPDLLERGLCALAAPEREVELERRLQENLESHAMIHPLPPLLAAADFAWGPGLGKVVLDFLRRSLLQEDKLPGETLGGWLRLAALRLPPALAREAGARWPLAEDLSPAAGRALAAFLSLVDFRDKMLEELGRDDSDQKDRRE